MGEVTNLRKTPRDLFDAVPADARSAVVIYVEVDGGWQVAYTRHDTSDLCFAEKILHREIMRRIEESRGDG